MFSHFHANLFWHIHKTTSSSPSAPPSRQVLSKPDAGSNDASSKKEAAGIGGSFQSPVESLLKGVQNE
jgi:hypothetical protein